MSAMAPYIRIRNRWACLLPILLVALQVFAANDPVLHLDLRSLGAVGLEVPVDEPSKPVYSGHVSFLDDSTLAISFPVFNQILELSTRDHSTGGSILLHTVLVDITTGQSTGEKSWGNAGKTDLITAGDRFVLIAGGRVKVFSRDWHEEREYRYQPDTPFRLRASATGKMLFYLTRGEQRELVDVLDISGRKAPYIFRVPSGGNDAMSDSNFAFARQNGKESEIFRASLEQLRQGIDDLHPLSYRPEAHCDNPFFITDELLILGGVCDGLTVIGPDGTIKVQQRFGELKVFGAAGTINLPQRLNYLAGFVTSRDQRRFAFVLRDAHGRARSGELPVATFHARTLCVYDTSLTKLFEIPVPQHAMATYALDQALSPDGSLVALLVGWTVNVYRVPEPRR